MCFYCHSKVSVDQVIRPEEFWVKYVWNKIFLTLEIPSLTHYVLVSQETILPQGKRTGNSLLPSRGSTFLLVMSQHFVWSFLMVSCLFRSGQTSRHNLLREQN